MPQWTKQWPQQALIFRNHLLIAIVSLVTPTFGLAADIFQVSPDITITMDAQTVTDESIAMDSGAISLANLGVLPANADLSAFHVLANGDRLLVLDISTTLPGGLYAEPRDVLRYNGASFTQEFDGSAAGIPAGVRIDALSVDQTGDLLMSFDISVDLGGVLAADEDLLRYSGAVFSLFFDGSAAGVASAMDLDAAHYLADSHRYLLSFDVSGQVGGTYFDDDDVLYYNPDSSSWSSAYRGASRHAGFNAADLNALYIAQYTSELFKDGFEAIP